MQNKILYVNLALLVILLSCFILFSFVVSGKLSFTQFTSVASETKYSALEDQKCKTPESYKNELILSKDVSAYDRLSFFSKNTLVAKDVISHLANLGIQQIAWDENQIDSNFYTGKALVCIIGSDKMATVKFNTKTSSFKNIIRYQDPENTISNVLIQAIYIVPNGADPVPDWQAKITANLQNIQIAQHRIFNNKSNIDFRIYPEVVSTKAISRDVLSNVAKGIYQKNADVLAYDLPIETINSIVYKQTNTTTAFFSNIEKYDQVTTLVYLEVGKNGENVANSRQYESGFASISPVFSNGNYFGIVGLNFRNDFSTSAVAYHEFMHTLGLVDEYPYRDGSIARSPTHIFNKLVQLQPTLMENARLLPLNQTYIDDQVLTMIGIQDL